VVRRSSLIDIDRRKFLHEEIKFPPARSSYPVDEASHKSEGVLDAAPVDIAVLDCVKNGCIFLWNCFEL
jgi:hypothetical protein